MAIEWDIFKIGSLWGLAALGSLLIWLGTRIYGLVTQPALKIYFDRNEDLRIYTFADTGWQRKFFTLHIKNSRRRTARRCVAVARVTDKPNSASHLEIEYTLHWGDIDYSGQTTAAQPVDMGSERRRLDVVFTDRNIQPGAWFSLPLALTAPASAGQAYLTPGEYEVEVRVRCENGRGDKGRFKVISPQQWTDLDASAVD